MTMNYRFSMFSRGFSISPSLWTTARAALILLACGGSFLGGQNQPAATTQVQSTMPVTVHDPTRPEVQRRLDVDRDPIPSPDAEDNPLGSTASPLAPARPGEIQKRQDGIYTMHQDVDEARWHGEHT